MGFSWFSREGCVCVCCTVCARGVCVALCVLQCVCAARVRTCLNFVGVCVAVSVCVCVPRVCALACFLPLYTFSQASALAGGGLYPWDHPLPQSSPQLEVFTDLHLSSPPPLATGRPTVSPGLFQMYVCQRSPPPATSIENDE